MTDLKNKITNVIAVLLIVLGVLYAAVDGVTAYLNTLPEGTEVDIFKLVMAIAVAIISWYTGKNTDGKALSIIAVMLVPLLFFGSVNTSFAKVNQHEVTVLQERFEGEIQFSMSAAIEKSLLTYINRDVFLFLYTPLSVNNTSTSLSINMNIKLLYRSANEQYQNKIMVKLRNEAIKNKPAYNFANYNIRMQQHRFNC